MEKTEITLYETDVTPLLDPEVLDAAIGLLSKTRQEKAKAYRFRKDRALSAGGGLLLRRMLSDSGLSEKEIIYGGTENGKPCFPAHPGIRFSLSHSGTRVVLAVSDREIGADIEKIRPADLRIAERFFCESECAAVLKGKTEEERNRRFFRLWTMKESFIKATGEGLSRAFSDFELRLPKKEGEVFALRDRDRSFVIREIRIDPDYCGAVCVETGDGDFGMLRQVHCAWPEI